MRFHFTIRELLWLTVVVALSCLYAGQARADFTYLSQSGSATASYSVPTATPPTGSVSWTEPTGFVDYSNNQISIGGHPTTNNPGGVSTTCDMTGTFHPTFLELYGGVLSFNAQDARGSDVSSGSQSRSVVFRNDTTQSWPIAGVLIVATNASIGTAHVTYSLKGSDGSDTELSVSAASEKDFTGQIQPGVTYTLSATVAESITASAAGSATLGPYATFDVKIGTVPEPPTLALGLAAVLVAILLRRA